MSSEPRLNDAKPLTTEAENVEILVRSKDHQFGAKYNARCLGEIVVNLTGGVTGAAKRHNTRLVPFALQTNRAICDLSVEKFFSVCAASSVLC